MDHESARFETSAWYFYKIMPNNIARSQWYRLHDDETMTRLKSFAWHCPNQTVIRIHDKCLERYLEDPNKLFHFHKRCSYLMTLCYYCEFGMNGMDVFNHKRYPEHTLDSQVWDSARFLDPGWACPFGDCQDRKAIKKYIEDHLDDMI